MTDIYIYIYLYIFIYIYVCVLCLGWPIYIYWYIYICVCLVFGMTEYIYLYIYVCFGFGMTESIRALVGFPCVKWWIWTITESNQWSTNCRYVIIEPSAQCTYKKCNSVCSILEKCYSWCWQLGLSEATLWNRVSLVDARPTGDMTVDGFSTQIPQQTNCVGGGGGWRVRVYVKIIPRYNSKRVWKYTNYLFGGNIVSYIYSEN